MTPAIQITNLSKFWKKQQKIPVLKNINLVIPESQCVVVLGPNGAGKTTLLKCILGLNFSDEGEIFLFSHPAGTSKAREKVSYLCELPTHFPFLKLPDFLNLFSCLKQIPRPKKDLRLIENISTTSTMSEYSKGMLQRANFIRALDSDPKLLFLDEPVSGLDPIGQLNMIAAIESCKKSGKTLYINTHNIDFAIAVADRILILFNGEIVRDLTQENIEKKSLETFFLGLENQRS